MARQDGAAASNAHRELALANPGATLVAFEGLPKAIMRNGKEELARRLPPIMSVLIIASPRGLAMCAPPLVQANRHRYLSLGRNDWQHRSSAPGIFSIVRLKSLNNEARKFMRNAGTFILEVRQNFGPLSRLPWRPIEDILARIVISNFVTSGDHQIRRRQRCTNVESSADAHGPLDEVATYYPSY